MNPWLKRTGMGMAVLAVVVTGSLGAAVLYSDSKMHRAVRVPAQPIALKTDSASIEHGRYLYQSRGCADCHGNDGGGRVFIEDPAAGLRISGANISAAAQGRVAGYAAEDWDRTIRHGVKPNGQPALFMPSEDFARLSDADLADVVAYVRQLPAVEGIAESWQLPVLVRLLYAVGVIEDAAEKIDHSLAPLPAITPAVTVEYGEYLAQSCKGCHGQHLSGGAIPGAPPAWPPAANLTRGEGGAIQHYADIAAFRAMLRSGLRPDGSAVSQVMPFAALGQINEVDSAALYVYLQSLAPVAFGNR